MTVTDLDNLCVNTIRVLAPEMVQKAKSGHPGAPMGLAPCAHVLWSKIMHYNPQDPSWLNRDRFVLSNGHACSLQYVMLHLSGYKISMDDLKSFRQLNSITPGHPENGHTPGIEVTTGPLGQGVSNAVGMAIAERHLAAEFNRPGYTVFDNHVYVFMGDGCMQEGVASEAASIAGHQQLSNLIVIWDDNKITIDGDTKCTFTEDVLARYRSYGWNTLTVEDGDHDVDGIAKTIEEAKLSKDKPTLIRVKTTIGFGSAKQGTEEVHGSPLGDEDLKNVKVKFGMDPAASFFVHETVRALYAKVQEKNVAEYNEWTNMMERYAKEFPAQFAELMRRKSGERPANWEAALPRYTTSDKPGATRKLSNKVLDNIFSKVPEMFGGSADLTISNCTWPKGAVDFQPESRDGRYFRFGIREHAMAAICNGIAAYGCIVPFCATFHNFVSYLLGAMRLSALSHFSVLYILTHDSIGLGEDGPTHQPIETNTIIRSIPNLVFIRPADGNETSGAYLAFYRAKNTPYAMALSRQDLPQLEGSSPEKVLLGGYVLPSDENPEIILVGAGSEVPLCVDAAKALRKEGVKVRVVSMPSTELFDQQPLEYRKSVLSAGCPVMSVEASSPMGWEKYANVTFGINKFGTSAPFKTCLEQYGFTTENIVAKSKQVISFYKDNKIQPNDVCMHPF